MPNSLQWSSGQDLSLSVVRYSADKARVQFPVSELLFAAALRVLGWLWGGGADWVVLVGISQLSDFVAPNGFGRSLYSSADLASDD
jgi:hypothetical protein